MADAVSLIVGGAKILGTFFGKRKARRAKREIARLQQRKAILASALKRRSFVSQTFQALTTSRARANLQGARDSSSAKAAQSGIVADYGFNLNLFDEFLSIDRNIERQTGKVQQAQNLIDMVNLAADTVTYFSNSSSPTDTSGVDEVTETTNDPGTSN